MTLHGLPFGLPHPSLGFHPLGHIHRARSGSHGLCLPATFRPQGLVTLSTVFSLARLAGLISCRQRLWGSPFEAFSSPQLLFRVPANTRPACRYLWTDMTDRSLLSRDRRLGFRVLPACASLAIQDGCLARPAAGCSLGFCPFQGSSPSAFVAASSHFLPRACLARQLPIVLRHASESRSTDDLPDCVSRASLLGFGTSTSLAFNRSPTLAIFSPRGPPRVSTQTFPLLGPATIYRSRQGC